MDKMSALIVSSLIAGLILALAYPPFDLEFLIWLGFVPIFYLLYKDRVKEFRPKIYFFSGLILGFVYFLILMKWLLAAYPLNWFGIENKIIGFSLILIFWVLGASAMGIFYGLWIFLLKNWLRLGKKDCLKIMIFGSGIFTITEYLRAWFFGLVWFGSGTFLGPHWTIGNLAYSLHNNPLFLKISSIVGIYGITFLVVLINFIFFYLFKSGQGVRSKLLNLSLIILIIFLLSYFPKKQSDKNYQNQESIPVAVIQTKIPSDINYPIEKQIDDFKTKLILFKESSKLNPRPKLLIFPEGADFMFNLGMFLNKESIKNLFEGQFNNEVLIIDNSRVSDQNGNTKSRVIYVNSKSEVLGFYDKRFLTPVGEFLPYYLSFLFKIFANDVASNFLNIKGIVKGNIPPKAVKISQEPEIKVGTLVCSGIFTPNIFRELSTNGANFLIAMTSSAVFRGDEGLLKQNLAIAKFRAAENNRFLILSANYGYSYIITNKGRVEKIAENKDPQIFTGKVIPFKNQTLYNKFKDIPILLTSILLVLLIFLSSRKN